MSKGDEGIKLTKFTELINDPQATALLASFKDITDPTYVGPGTWNIIHRFARKAITSQLEIQFIEMMKIICKEFPCKVCRGHCTEYISNNPMEQYKNIKEDKELVGMFLWSWKFHNAVNLRLKKPIMSWETAYNLYPIDINNNNDTTCNSKCMEADNNNNNTTEVKSSKTNNKVQYVPFRN